MAEVVYFIAALGANAGAVGTVTLRNPSYSVLGLVFHLLSLAALFLLLRAEFVAAAQVVVYAGAVMVLYMFVVAYVGGDRRALAAPVGGRLKLLSALFAGALFIELCIAMIGSTVSVLDSEGTGFFRAFGTPKEIGRLLLTDFLLAFELASILLLIAAVGAVVLARRRSGTEMAGDLSVADVLRGSHGTNTPAELETQSEAAGPARR